MNTNERKMQNGDYIPKEWIENAEQVERETEIDDVIAWADGIMGALGTEHANKVTEQEARIADLIQRGLQSVRPRQPPRHNGRE